MSIVRVHLAQVSVPAHHGASQSRTLSPAPSLAFSTRSPSQCGFPKAWVGGSTSPAVTLPMSPWQVIFACVREQGGDRYLDIGIFFLK